MRIDFRDADRINALGYAGYLRISTVDKYARYHGALLTVNANSEPIEFIYNYIEMNHPALWQGVDRERYAIRRLSASLLKKCAIVPQLILCLESETYQELFHSEILLAIPVCMIGTEHSEAVKLDIADVKTAHENSRHFKWMSGNPAEGSMAKVLFEELNSKSFFMEVFERAAAGLQEVFSKPVDS